MMEDPESEWEIQEYSSSEGDETTMVKWILNKGYGIGKKIVITGIAISSAPLVLPPLVVFSAMGVVFSVPFGLIFASYACTNKLMSTLLPTPPSPLMLEYYTDEFEQEKDGVECRLEIDDGGDDYRKGDAVEKVYYTVENEDDYGQEVEASVTNVDGDSDEKGYYTDKEGNERMENINQGAEIVLEVDDGSDDDRQEKETLITNMDEDVDEKSCYINEKESEREMEDGMLKRENVTEEEEREDKEGIKQGVKTRPDLDVAGYDQGYEEDVGEYLEGDDDSLEKEQKGEEPLVESQIDEKSNTREVNEDEKEEIVKGSTGLLDKLRDGGRVDNMVKDYYILGGSVYNVGFEDVKDVATTGPVTVKEIDTQKLVKVGSENEEFLREVCHVMILAGENDENNFNSRGVEELDLVAGEVIGDTIKDKSNIEFDEKVMRESMGTQKKTGGNTSKDGSEDTILRTKKELLTHSNADAREISDENGLDLFDEKNTNIDFKSREVGNEVKENTAERKVDSLALRAFKRSPLDTDNAKVTSKTNMKMPSREDILDEEKIWEKIGAMRTIVGYKAPSQPTCIGELKALYVFTGVEPPASFKGDSDLDEVNSKLKFLMSIVGVK